MGHFPTHSYHKIQQLRKLQHQPERQAASPDVHRPCALHSRVCSHARTLRSPETVVCTETLCASSQASAMHMLQQNDANCSAC